MALLNGQFIPSLDLQYIGIPHVSNLEFFDRVDVTITTVLLRVMTESKREREPYQFFYILLLLPSWIVWKLKILKGFFRIRSTLKDQEKNDKVA